MTKVSRITQEEEQSIKAVPSVGSLGIEIDDKLSLTYTLVKFVTLKKSVKGYDLFKKPRDL